MQPTTPIAYAGYHLLSSPKSGAYGHVYEATHLKTGKKVALKFMKSPNDSDDYKRFKLENVILHKLNPHINIVRPHSNAIHDGTNAFYSMEYLELDIDALLAHIPSNDIDKKIKLAIEICSGLHHSHENDVFHRDLHPGNIRIESISECTPKISDFGLSKMLTSQFNSNVPLLAWGGGIKPPEVALFTDDDPSREFFVRGDIYALGIIINYIFSASNVEYVLNVRASITNTIQRSGLAYPTEYIKLPLQERIEQYNQWLSLFNPSTSDLLNVYLTDVELSKKLSIMIKKMCHIDPALRYDSVGAIISELERLY